MVGLLKTDGRRWSMSNSTLFLLFNLFFCLVSGEFVEVSEKIRLLELKNAISDPYGMLSSWKPANHDHCSWYGVTCNAQARVSELRIPGGNYHCSSAKKGRFLSGKLSNAIGDLLELRVLSIPFHRIVGVLPESIWGLKNLEVIDIEGNSITGNISMIDFTKLKKLQVLNLGFNRFYGEIPKSLAECKGLRVINLAKNPIHGTIPGFAGGLRPSPPQPRRVLGGGKKTGFSSLEMVLGSRIINRIRTIPGFAGGLSPSPPQPRRVLSGSGSGKEKGFSSVDVVLISAASLIVIVLIALIIAYFYVRHRRRNSRVDGVQSPPRSGTERLVVFKEVGVPLTFDTVIQATGNFTLRNCIGSGGFGSTYRAEISPGTTVAVKRLTVEMCQGVPQFNAEIRSLGKIRHPNLITLIGYYASSSEMFLVYNYLPGGSLEDFIREKRARTGLKIIHKLATEIAVALAFLHEDCNPRILHRDVKPSNILLDDNLKPYLSDFGLSRLLEGFETHVTTGVAGTFGYVAPEYALACRASDKADVYSYGVMLLELISDKRALDPSFSHQQNGYTIVSWAGTLWREGRTTEVFAAGMWDSGPENVLRELLELGLVCTHESAAKRPKMKQVVRVLRQIQSEFDL